MEVVGVVADSKWIDLRNDPPPIYHRPYSQEGGTPVVRFAIRTSGDLGTLAVALNQIAKAVHPHLVLRTVVPFGDLVNRTMLIERLIAHVAGATGVLALLVVCIGLFGVFAYAVARRTREIGVRLALGADRRVIRRMVLGEALALLMVELPLGLLGGMLGTGSVAAMLYGVTPSDVTTSAGVVALLVTVSLAATYIPAHRATRVDPMVALRAK